jgi:hypothetical protein
VWFSPDALRDVLKKWWWILPVSVGACTGLLFVQESGFVSEPARVESYRRYEGTEAISSLAALDIEAQAFAPILTLAGEINRFNADARNTQRNEANGFDVRLSVAQVPGDFTVIDREISQRNTVYSVIQVGTGVFTFSCTEASERDCDTALDIGVAEFESLRNASINSSIQFVRDRINARLAGLREMLTTADDQTALLAQRQLEAQLASQVSALDVALEETSFELQFVDEWTSAKSATVSTVTTSTYFLGVILGLIIGSLIILQFVALRSRRS